MLTLAEALAGLPDTADGIADRMRALGIKGKQLKSGCCPIANWLKTEGFTHASVGQTACLGRRGSATTEDVRSPRAVAEFVRRFDAGVYLDLVEVVS